MGKMLRRLYGAVSLGLFLTWLIVIFLFLDNKGRIHTTHQQIQLCLLFGSPMFLSGWSYLSLRRRAEAGGLERFVGPQVWLGAYLWGIVGPGSICMPAVHTGGTMGIADYLWKVTSVITGVGLDALIIWLIVSDAKNVARDP